MTEITIGTDEKQITVDEYLNNYSVNIVERYASSVSFTSISGKSTNKYLGDRRELSVNFEPMSTEQITDLISTIKHYKNNIPIGYIDPQYGKTIKRFSCNTLPAATYFVSDDGIQFWTIPTVNFSETDESASENDEEDGERWDYEIIIGENVYGSDEISDNISINFSAGSDGFSVGQCCTSSISGDVLYKGINEDKEPKEIHQNAVLILRCMKAGTVIKEYKFFVKSYHVENELIAHFSANDVMAFIDNEYPMEGTVLSHYNAAAKILSQLCNQSVEITAPAYPYKEILNQSGWSIRTLLGYGGVYGGANYYADGFKISQVPDTTISISKDNYSNLSIGISGPRIEQIRVSRSDIEDPILEEGETYEDFYIYYLSNKTHITSNTLRLVCPWVEQDIKADSFLADYLHTSYGTEFNCDNVKLDAVYPPYTKVGFESNPENEKKDFYISNATYKFTSIGIFASISGSTKSLSDFEYIGKTETELKTKVALQMGYRHGFISIEDGIYWDDSGIEEVVNSG